MSLPHSIGTVVCFKTHYIKSPELINEIGLSGLKEHVPPLMVVIESSQLKNAKYNTETGEEINAKNAYKYNCQWFSTVSFKFESTWILGKYVEKIDFPLDIDANIKIGENVLYSTAHLEVAKLKTALEIAGGVQKQKATPFLDYTAPVLHVIGTKEPEIKESLIDSKTGDTIRWIPEKLIKCKYFVQRENKYAECLIPEECLLPIPKITKSKAKAFVKIQELEEIVHLNTTEQFDKYNKDVSIIHSQNDYEIVCQVKSQFVLNGYHFINVENLFTEFLHTIRLDTIIKNKTLELEADTADTYPSYNWDGETFNEFTILDYFNNQYNQDTPSVIFQDGDKIQANFVLKLLYENRMQKISSRYVLPIEVIQHSYNNVEEDAVNDLYLRGFCLRKKEVRFFKVSRIKTMNILYDETLYSFATKLYDSLN